LNTFRRRDSRRRAEGARKRGKQYSIAVGNQDLSRIKTGFAFVVAGQNRPVVVYLDAIRFE
jgi:hypothetical protein